jgi:uncharacterized protein YndB with AHSA1/START domain
MSLNEITIDAPPEVVWEVLADPPSYESWVVGNKAIRAYEGRWPEPGSEFHHKVGFGPITVKDKSRAVEADPPRRLVMHVRAMPVGTGIVIFELEPVGSGKKTRVRMEEHVESGPTKLVEPLVDPLMHLRNAETLRRLRRVAEERYRSVAAAAGDGPGGSAAADQR